MMDFIRTLSNIIRIKPTARKIESIGNSYAPVQGVTPLHDDHYQAQLMMMIGLDTMLLLLMMMIGTIERNLSRNKQRLAYSYFSSYQ